MNVLGWNHWRILAVETHEHDYLITASRETGPFACPQCGSTHIHKHDTGSQLYLDTPIHGKRVGICVLKKCFQCQSCHHRFYEALPEMHPAHFMTQRLVEYIEQQALRHTFVSVADQVGVDEGTVRQVFAAYQKQQQQAMVKVTHVVTFASPASRVFAVLTDFEHAYRWQTGEVLKEWKETDQPLGIGSTIYQRRLFLGKPIESMNLEFRIVLSFAIRHQYQSEEEPRMFTIC